MVSIIIQSEAEILDNLLSCEGNFEEQLEKLYRYDQVEDSNYCLFARLKKFMLQNNKTLFKQKSIAKQTINHYDLLLSEFEKVTNEDISIDGVLKYLEYEHTVKHIDGIDDKLKFLYCIEIGDNERLLELKKEIISECLSLELMKENDLDLEKISDLNRQLKELL